MCLYIYILLYNHFFFTRENESDDVGENYVQRGRAPAKQYTIYSLSISLSLSLSLFLSLYLSYINKKQQILWFCKVSATRKSCVFVYVPHSD